MRLTPAIRSAVVRLVASFGAAVLALFCIGPAPSAVTPLPLVSVGRGIALATITDSGLLDADAPGALSIQALRLEPAQVRLRAVMANDRLPALERVLDIATRTHALAAINAGYFTPSGGPAGLLVVDGQPIGFGVHPRGAVAIMDDDDQTRLAFARTRLRAVPDVLAAPPVRLAFWSPDGLDLSAWRRARDVVGGAGLLVRDGQAVTDVGVERMRDDFPVVRHPRSVIGTDGEGAIWLVAVDGRRPGHSVGMSFRELHRLTALLGLRDALNLDGGGSTTLVVGGAIVNRPTDATGPRAVSDAIVVLPR